MDSKMYIVVVLALVLAATSVNGETNSTYTEPEEISDSIPVAITILVILVVLLLIFYIILLLICIKIVSKSTRRKDIEDHTPIVAYRKDSGERHRHGEPSTLQAHPQQQPRNQPQTQPVSMPGHMCMCNECQEIRQEQRNNQRT